MLGDPDDAITTLSGGNQQKVVIARWLAAGPRVLLLNDPTRGIDIGAKRDLYALLGAARRGGPRGRHALDRARRARRADGPRARLPRARAVPRDRARSDSRATRWSSAFFGEQEAGDGMRRSCGDRDPVMAAPVQAGVVVRLLRLLNRYSFGFALLLTIALLVANADPGRRNFGWQRPARQLRAARPRGDGQHARDHQRRRRLRPLDLAAAWSSRAASSSSGSRRTALGRRRSRCRSSCWRRRGVGAAQRRC